MTDNEMRVAIARMDGWGFALIEGRYLGGRSVWDVTAPDGTTRDSWQRKYHTMYGPDSVTVMFHELNETTLEKANIPEYLNSHDALATVLEAITDLDKQESIMEMVLESVIERNEGVMLNSGWAIATAPARDWCEALMRAKGLVQP